MGLDCAAIVLAAGASRRMRASKARLPWKGSPAVCHLTTLATRLGFDPVVAVDGADRLEDLGLPRLAHNDRWQDGPLSSLQCGLRAVSGAAACLVLSVDRPHIEATTLRALAAKLPRAPSGIIRPLLSGQGGHPYIVTPLWIARLLALPPTASARDVLRTPEALAARVSVDVDDPAVLDNVDTPEDWARITQDD